MNRRDFILSSAAAASARTRAAAELSVDGIAEGLRGGRLTVHGLARFYLERIRLFDRQGPAINAVIEADPTALSQAALLDREHKAGKSRGPLHGVSVLVKDNIDIAGGMKTTAGSLALAGHAAAEDAPLVARLREAGAVILGKTNLSEWANFRSTHSVSGWSARGGQTHNPYAHDRDPSGSSSGSAAAVAANFCTVAVGTETDGSITSPASINGIVGMKPTVGIVPANGIIPISHTQDTAGPMARTVADAARLLGVLTGRDFSSALDPNALRGVRLGVARKFFGHNPKADHLIESRLGQLSSLGARLVDPADLPSHGQFKDAEFEVMLYEFKAGLNAYLGKLPAGAAVRSLAELIAFNEKHRAREMPLFEQEILIMAEEKGPLTERKYLDALALGRRLSQDEGIDAVLKKHSVDAIVCPTSGPAWLIDTVNGDYDVGDCTTPAAVAGYPHITVPAGLVAGLPVGLSFFGGANTDAWMIRFAYTFEQSARARRAPQIG